MVNPVSPKNINNIPVKAGEQKISFGASLREPESASDLNCVDKKVSDAAAFQGKMFVKQKFRPAKDASELNEQIKKIDWLSDENKDYDFRSLKRLSDDKIKLISVFLHKAEKLTPELKSKFNMFSFFSRATFSDCKILEEFSPEEFNALNPDIQKGIKNLSFHAFAPVKDAKGVNKFYETADESYRDIIPGEYRLLCGDKKTNEKLINLAEVFNSAENGIRNKLDLKSLFVKKDINIDYMNNVLKAISELDDDKKDNLSSTYINLILFKNYSYALACKDKAPVCGSENFKPFETKEEMITELASMRKQNGEWMFSNEDILKITENGNDFGEMSKILNDFSLRKFNFEPETLKNILMREGVTYDIIKPAAEFYNEIRDNDEYKSLKTITEKSPESIFLIEPSELASVKEHKPVADVLYEYDPVNFVKFNNASFKLIKNATVSPDVLSEILNDNFYNGKPDVYELENLVTAKDGREIKRENIEFLRDLKNCEKLDFLFNGLSFNNLNNYDISELLTQKLPDGFKLSSKQNMINFFADIHKNLAKEAVIGNSGVASHYLEILTKNNDDDTEYAEKIVDFAVNHNLADCNSYHYLTNHLFKETYDLMSKFENNPLLCKRYSLIPDYDVKLLEDFERVCAHASTLDAFKTLPFANFRSILDAYKTETKFAEEFNMDSVAEIDVKNVNSNLNLLNEVSKTIKPELWNDVKTAVFENTVRNRTGKSYTLKFNNIAYMNDIYSDSRFKEAFGYINSACLNRLLTQDLDTDILSDKKDEMFEFVKRENDEEKLCIDKNSFISYEGDYKLLNDEITRLEERYPNEEISVSASKDRAIVTRGDYAVSTYDKNMQLIHKTITAQMVRDNGTSVTGLILDDSSKNIKTYRISAEDATTGEPKTEKLVSIYSGDNGRHIKTKEYKASEVPGFVDIKETSATGEETVIAKTQKTPGGIFSEKHLTSPSGVTTDTSYEINSNGDEKYLSVIRDGSGNILSSVERTTQILDKDNKKTAVNGREYLIHYGEDDIEVKDTFTGETCNISISKINPDKNITIYNLLKELPGDELIQMQNFVNKIVLTQKIESCINPVDRTMFVGPHPFIFEHEFGHGKDELSADKLTMKNIVNDEFDSRIAVDDNLREIFETEKKELYDTAPSAVADEVMYFIADGDSHYGGEKGGLKETIAEANGIQSGLPFHPLLQMRTQILQEYFPQTSAYLNNKYLLPQ